MDLGIAGKSVFFTGGSKGMGRDAAAMLAAEGCKVAIVARTKHDIDEAVESIKDAGGTAIGVSADITNHDDVERAVAEVRAAFGPPLIAIGQTKFNIPGDFSDITDYEHYVESFRSYTMSQVYLLHQVLPGMKAARVGSLRAHRLRHRQGAGGRDPPRDRQRDPAFDDRAAQDRRRRVRAVRHHGQHGRARVGSRRRTRTTTSRPNLGSRPRRRAATG